MDKGECEGGENGGAEHCKAFGQELAMDGGGRSGGRRGGQLSGRHRRGTRFFKRQNLLLPSPCLSLALPFSVSPRTFRFECRLERSPSVSSLPTRIIYNFTYLSSLSRILTSSLQPSFGSRYSALIFLLSILLPGCFGLRSCFGCLDDCYRGSPRALPQKQCVCG